MSQEYNSCRDGLGAMATRRLVIDVPETVLLAEKMDATSFAQELRVLAAVKLYELGRLSSGRAAELAGMPPCRVSPQPGPLQSLPFRI